VLVRVLIGAESFLPNVDGVSHSVLRVLDHLEAAGHDAAVLAPSPGPDRYRRARVERLPSVRLPRYRSLAVGLPHPKVDEVLRTFRPDVVHLAAPAVLGAAVAVSARRHRVPTVAVFQTDLAGFARRYGAGVAGPAIWSWLRWVHGQAAITLAPSTQTMWQLEQQRIGPLRLWPRGVDVERFAPGRRSEVVRQVLAPDGEAIVGYVGRLAAEKQVGLLAPLQDVPGVRLVVIGDGPERARLQAQLPRAQFLGFRRGDDLARLVASLDVFVHTGVDETFCQAVQEALASGVPVVAPAAGGPVDLVEHGRNGWLWPTEEPGLLRGAVTSLLADPERRAAMGRAARAGVVHRSWASVGDQLLDVYAEVGQDAPPRRRARWLAA
jgi:phosphatidylinositol alpha 1,6-mannosyltransferase